LPEISHRTTIMTIMVLAPETVNGKRNANNINKY